MVATTHLSEMGQKEIGKFTCFETFWFPNTRLLHSLTLLFSASQVVIPFRVVQEARSQDFSGFLSLSLSCGCMVRKISQRTYAFTRLGATFTCA
jgi:hypothetical protein